MTDNPPAATAGWYSVPGGGKRFWNGFEWTTDVIGAPNAQAEYVALAPDMPPPSQLVIAPGPQQPILPPAQIAAYGVPQIPPAGWYPGPSGIVQWWDGRAWGPYAPQSVHGIKEVGIGRGCCEPGFDRRDRESGGDRA